MKIKKTGPANHLVSQMICCFWLLAFLPFQAFGSVAPGRTLAQQATKTKKLWITTDHSKHDILKQDFKSGPEVTKACLTCHSEAASQFHKTIHWTWKDPATGDEALYGKGGLSVNNF